MSFSDLISSGRGPGVIGTLMALLVLVGFGALLMLAENDSTKTSGKSIEYIIKQQSKDLDENKMHLAEQQKFLAILPERLAQTKSLDESKEVVTQTQKKCSQLKADFQTAQQNLAAELAKFEEYKNQYRTHVRGKAKDKTMESLTTKSGVIYKNVNIREVTAIGIQIRHEDGHKRIAFEELPAEMQDYYQYDHKQKKEALAEEAAARSRQDAAAAEARTATAAMLLKQQEQNAEAQKIEISRQIDLKEDQISQVADKIRSLHEEKRQAAKEASNAKASGRIHIAKRNSYVEDIRSNEALLNQMKAELSQLKTSR